MLYFIKSPIHLKIKHTYFHVCTEGSVILKWQDVVLSTLSSLSWLDFPKTKRNNIIHWFLGVNKKYYLKDIIKVHEIKKRLCTFPWHSSVMTSTKHYSLDNNNSLSTDYYTHFFHWRTWTFGLCAQKRKVYSSLLNSWFIQLLY